LTIRLNIPEDYESENEIEDDESFVILSSSSNLNSDEEQLTNTKKISFKKLKIHCGMKVMGLYDKTRHIWKTATIQSIRSFKNVNSSYEENCLKINSNANYIVEFDVDLNDLKKYNNLITEYEYNKEDLILSENDSDSMSTDLSSSSSSSRSKSDINSSNNDSETNLKTKKRSNKRKKRRYYNKYLNQKKANIINNKEIVKLDATCVAFYQTDSNFLPDLPYIDHYKEIDRMILPTRSRVVALYSISINCNKNEMLIESDEMISGTIVELPSARNSSRYLIFFDNGYVSYADPKYVYPIFNLFKTPLERLDFDHVHFMNNYFDFYPERVMVKLEQNEMVTAYINNKWHQCKVLEIDASLVRLQFDLKMFSNLNENIIHKTLALDEHTIWFYRGSYKLLPLYEIIMQKITDFKINPNVNLNDFEKYIKDKQKETTQNKKLSLFASSSFPIYGPNKNKLNKKAIAKDNNNIDQSRIVQGRIRQLLDLADYMRNEILTFSPHPCTNSCVSKWENKIEIVKSVNPLLMPCMHGWQRLICHKSKTITNGSMKWVNYMAPCGRIFRSTNEVDRYLFLTNSILTIDMFSFDCYILTDREYEGNAKYVLNEDITEGKELIPISCVNCIDDTKPETVAYSSQRIALENVPLEIDINSLEGCKCEDNCRDRSKCLCWRKTFEMTTFCDNNEMNTNVGYRGRKLLEMVNTGIFECNPLCKCDHRCSNRVVQNGISLRLQLFKTSSIIII